MRFQFSSAFMILEREHSRKISTMDSLRHQTKFYTGFNEKRLQIKLKKAELNLDVTQSRKC